MSSKILQFDTVWTDPFYELNETLTVLPGVNFTIQGSPDFPILVHFTSKDVQIRLQSNVRLTIRDAIFIGGGGIEDLNDDPLFVTIERISCLEMRACFQRLWSGPSEIKVSDSIFVDNQLVLNQCLSRTLSSCATTKRSEGVTLKFGTVSFPTTMGL